ncbi:RagB/SusD family nutrient uptake outer membrane protein [Gaetbulibacter aestuarii]|uniref:RagB/SusD family nutrient uptake outer membrane protein n=1 Tax=Gaetbulibacter aestuarii TaxID=1502358 RepID=A0ABW7MZP7_9FLAO
MKKILIIFGVLFAVTSCGKEFIERSSPTEIAENNFWQSEQDAFLALNGVYSALQSKSLYGGNLNGWQGFAGFDGLGDNAFNQYKWEGLGVFMEGTADPSSGPLNQIWNDSYTGIARVNQVIKNVQTISEDLVDAETKKQLLGQGYFLRGLLYFNLAVYFEDAPLITEPQTLDEAYVPKNTYDEIIAQVREDLKFASANLPEAYPDNLYGYATKGAALGLFARVQLYNKVYDGPDGVLDLTQQAMGLGYSLDPDYAGLFTPEKEQSPEIVFSVRFLRGAATQNGETFSGTYQGTPKVDQRPMPNLVNDYYCTDGLPVTTSPLFNPADERDNRDPRAIATIYFKGDQYYDNPVKIFPGNGPTGYGMRKYIRRGPDAEGNASFGEGSQDFYVIRYADILLMRAEAMAETGDVAGATALVDQIRARVNMPSVESVEGAVGQQEMIQIVRHERRVELALEGLRFMDLKRWGEIEEGFNRAIADPVGPYNPSYQGKKSEVFPIPQNEIDVNPNLVQNPAWQ